jgi:hypothetical protein
MKERTEVWQGTPALILLKTLEMMAEWERTTTILCRFLAQAKESR